jgi:hypothetical protein
MDFPSCSSSIMNLRFYIDPQTDAPHIYNYGVDEEEVEAVLQRPGEDRPGRDGSRVAMGQTRNRTACL